MGGIKIVKFVSQTLGNTKKGENMEIPVSRRSRSGYGCGATVQVSNRRTLGARKKVKTDRAMLVQR